MGRFTIVFEKLQEAREESDRELATDSHSSRTENEEISELRRFALELTEPEYNFYTTT
jgi:hypothetical protein